MSLPVRLRLAAQAEYDEAADWYESRQSGVGSRFIQVIEKVLAEIGDRPDRWPEVLPGIRQRPIKKWPFCIYYQVYDDHVLVLSIFHTSRDPSVWQSRI